MIWNKKIPFGNKKEIVLHYKCTEYFWIKYEKKTRSLKILSRINQTDSDVQMASNFQTTPNMA